MYIHGKYHICAIYKYTVTMVNVAPAGVDVHHRNLFSTQELFRSPYISVWLFTYVSTFTICDNVVDEDPGSNALSLRLQ